MAIKSAAVITKGIPFPITLNSEPTFRDTMTSSEFDLIMKNGLSEAKADNSRPAADVFKDLKTEPE